MVTAVWSSPCFVNTESTCIPTLTHTNKETNKQKENPCVHLCAFVLYLACKCIEAGPMLVQLIVKLNPAAALS